MSASPGSSPTPPVQAGAARPSLCLTCASSILPKTPDRGGTAVFTTPCCKRVICANCLLKNARLRAYDPCLACLAGADATTTGRASRRYASRSKKVVELLFDADAQDDAAADADGRGVNSKASAESGLEVNGLMESEMFTIGDSDDDEEDKDEDKKEDGRDGDERLGSLGIAMKWDAIDVPGPRLDFSDPPPCYEADQTVAPVCHEQSDVITNLAKPTHDSSREIQTHSQAVQPSKEEANFASPSDPTKYYIQPKDTLSGISLKLGINGRRLARLNNLPASTLTTTPHLLHTRRFLTLPANARILSSIMNHDSTSASNDDEIGLGREKKRERARARERAAKRFAFVTKEVDYRIAKAYVAIADDFVDDEYCDIPGDVMSDKKERTRADDGMEGDIKGSNRKLEARAIERYLDDDEWEQAELRAGRTRTPRPATFAIQYTW